LYSQGRTAFPVCWVMLVKLHEAMTRLKGSFEDAEFAWARHDGALSTTSMWAYPLTNEAGESLCTLMASPTSMNHVRPVT
jgi:hypothetical protein